MKLTITIDTNQTAGFVSIDEIVNCVSKTIKDHLYSAPNDMYGAIRSNDKKIGEWRTDIDIVEDEAPDTIQDLRCPETLQSIMLNQ